MNINSRGAVLLDSYDDNRELEQFPIKNIPLKEINWDIPVFKEDIVEGQWPPKRCMDRLGRQEVLATVAKGDIRHFCDAPSYINRFDSLLSISRGVLFSDKPKHETFELKIPISRMLFDSHVFSKSLVLNFGDRLFVPNIENCWPIGGTKDDWVIVIPLVGRESSSGEYTEANVFVLENNKVVFKKFKVDHRIGESHYTFTTGMSNVVEQPTTWKSMCYSSSYQNSWGTGTLEKIIPILAEYAQIESVIGFMNTTSGIPPLWIETNKTDFSQFLDKQGAPFNKEVPKTLSQKAEIAKVIRKGAIIFGADGAKGAKYIERARGIEDLTVRFTELNSIWTQMTGQVAYEAGDVSEASSGVSLARRQAALVVRLTDWHDVAYDTLEFLIGDFNWMSVDMLNNVAQQAGVNKDANSSEPTESPEDGSDSEDS